MKRKSFPVAEDARPVFVRSKPEKMVTLVCKSCGMALYMSERILNEATWKCPSCKAITKTAVAAGG